MQPIQDEETTPNEEVAAARIVQEQLDAATQALAMQQQQQQQQQQLPTLDDDDQQELSLSAFDRWQQSQQQSQQQKQPSNDTPMAVATPTTVLSDGFIAGQNIQTDQARSALQAAHDRVASTIKSLSSLTSVQFSKPQPYIEVVAEPQLSRDKSSSSSQSSNISPENVITLSVERSVATPIVQDSNNNNNKNEEDNHKDIKAPTFVEYMSTNLQKAAITTNEKIVPEVITTAQLVADTLNQKVIPELVETGRKMLDNKPWLLVNKWPRRVIKWRMLSFRKL